MYEKILIVDDEPEILDTLETILKMEDYQVCRAESGQDAIQLFQTEGFDLVITDNSMPVMSGIEVIQRIKKLDATVEVIVLTGHATMENAVQALKEGGAFNYLTKPIGSIDDFLVIIRRALEKRQLRLENNTLIQELKQEVKDRKIVERQLLRSKRTFQSVFDGMGEPLMLLAHDMSVKVINKAARDYSNAHHYKDVLGKPCYQVFAGKSAPCRDCNFHVSMLSGKTMIFERKGLKNPEVTEEVVIYPLRDRSGGRNDAIVRIRDITSKKRVEERLMRADRLASLGQLSGGIAHEIRNPLASIKLFKDILYDQEKFHRTVQEIEILDEIEDSINRIDGIIKRVLDFAKSKSASLVDIGINELIRESARLWSPNLRKFHVALKLELEHHLPMVHGDMIGLQQVIYNLVLNAIEAMGRGGSLSIKTTKGLSTHSARQKAVFIEVNDTGPGISRKHWDSIFNPFFTTKSTGTGLGLSISHQIIKHHSGNFSFESQPEKGTTFRIELPAQALDHTVIEAQPGTENRFAEAV